MTGDTGDRLVEEIVRIEKERDHYEELYEKHIAFIELLQKQVVIYRTGLEQIADSHLTFTSAQRDLRGQHCIDLELIARTTLTEGEMSGAQRQVGEDNA